MVVVLPNFLRTRPGLIQAVKPSMQLSFYHEASCFATPKMDLLQTEETQWTPWKSLKRNHVSSGTSQPHWWAIHQPRDAINWQSYGEGTILELPLLLYTLTLVAVVF